MNKKTKFFKNALLFQFIPVLLLGIWISLDNQRQEILKIREIHPYEFSLGLIAPIIFLGFSCLVSIIIFSLKNEQFEADEKEDLKKLRQNNFWKFAFYCNVFFVIIIAVFSFGIFRKDPFVIDQIILFYCCIFFRCVLIVIISMITASFLLTTGIYWKTNKILAFTILIFSILIISVTFVYEVIFIGEFMTHSENYNNAHLGKKGDSENDSYTSEESDGESYDEKEKATLIAAWNYFIEKKYDLEGKDDFLSIRSSIHYTLFENIIEEDHYYLLNYIITNKDDPNALYDGFEKYKFILYNSISEKTYRVSNFNKIVNGLLATYEDVLGDSEKLNAIYQIMDVPLDGQELDAYDYYPKIKKYFSDDTVELLEKYELSNNNHYNKSDIVWFYSFWARRQHEGNIKEVAIILNEIKDNYKIDNTISK